jgi:hypothetical protein
MLKLDNQLTDRHAFLRCWPEAGGWRLYGESGVGDPVSGTRLSERWETRALLDERLADLLHQWVGAGFIPSGDPFEGPKLDLTLIQDPN